MSDNEGTSGWVEQFLTAGDELHRGGVVEPGQVGVRLPGDFELTDRAENLALFGRELYERFSGQAFPEGVKDPRVLILGNPVNGFSYYGPTPLNEGDDNYLTARTMMVEQADGTDWWLAPLAPLSDLEPIDGDDRPPVKAKLGPVERARLALQAIGYKPTEDRLADLVADLMHLAQEQDLDPDDVVDHGIRYYRGDVDAETEA